MYEQQDNPEKLWLPKIEDWGKIEDRAYEVIFNQAKERFEELMGNSEDITTRGERLLIGLSSVIAAFFGTSFKLNVEMPVIAIAIILYGINLFVLLSLLLAKRAQTRGSRPSEAFPDNLDDGSKYKAEEQVKLVYYKQIIFYEVKIAEMKKLNNFRSWVYQVGLIYTFVLIVASILYILYSIFRP